MCSVCNWVMLNAIHSFLPRYRKMETCISPLPDTKDEGEVAGGALAKWPARLVALPPRIASNSLAGIIAETFNTSLKLWEESVKYYKNSLHWPSDDIAKLWTWTLAWAVLLLPLPMTLYGSWTLLPLTLMKTLLVSFTNMDLSGPMKTGMWFWVPSSEPGLSNWQICSRITSLTFKRNRPIIFMWFKCLGSTAWLYQIVQTNFDVTSLIIREMVISSTDVIWSLCDIWTPHGHEGQTITW